MSKLHVLAGVALLAAACGCGGAGTSPLTFTGFDAVSARAMAKVPMGYELTVRGDFRPAWALKKLPEPFTKRMVLRGKVRSAVADIPENVDPNIGHVVRNAFLAFGDGASDARLAKAGAWIGGGKYSIFQGPWTPRLPAVFVEYDPDKTFDVQVEVDLEAQTVTATIDGLKFTQPLEPRLRRITHYGFWVLNTSSQFSELEVEGE